MLAKGAADGKAGHFVISRFRDRVICGRFPGAIGRLSSSNREIKNHKITKSRNAPILNNFVQHAGKRAGALLVGAGDGIVLLLEQVVLVGDVEGGENCDSQRIHRRGLLGYGTHLQIDIFSKVENVICVAAAEVITLVVNVNADASRSGFLCAVRLCAHAGTASLIASICFSIFSTRLRTSSRSRRSITICSRKVSTCSSRSSNCSRKRLTSRSAIILASRADLRSSMVR